ncbi:type I glyceraldehyde-3-phosphate dehydrogenase [Pseudomonas sp. HK3]|jgi:glyceraldehyde 3-phosphate dehydrogenase
MIKVAINGFGRIGRNVVRALYEKGYREHIQIVAVNDLGDADKLAHLLKYDSVHGTFNYPVSHSADSITINHDEIPCFKERDPKALPWASLDIDVVFECTGFFTEKETAQYHIKAGAKNVMISAPANGADKTIVYGINHHTLTRHDRIISNASCTTNCLAPVAKALHDSVGIESGLMTTVHAFTNDQQLTDGYHSDLRRARSATSSVIPTKTGAASAIGLVMPELMGKLDGLAVRVPTNNVSLVDLTFMASRDTTVDEINQALVNAAKDSAVMSINELPLVSIDFLHNDSSSIADITQTKVNGKLVKVLAWYDNEWAFSMRMLDNTLAWLEQ